ncbi:MAG: hypothetical protein V4612_04230 [Pseudomonadota bacterium]
MNKKKFAFIALIILVLCYVGLWFFQTMQYKKQIKKFIESRNKIILTNSGAANNSKASIGDISVSVLPFYNKITIKDFRLDVADNAYLVIKNIQINYQIFSHNFSIESLPPIMMVSGNKNVVSTIEFNPDSKISGVIQNQDVAQLKYIGSGYKILDAQKNVEIVVESKNFQTLLLNDQSDQSELKISSDELRILNNKNNILFTCGPLAVAVKSFYKNETVLVAAKFDVKMKNFEYLQNGTLKNNQTNNEIKNNLSLSALINFSGQQANKPAQSQRYNQKIQATNPYIWNMDLQNFDFSNRSYRIIINGKLSNPGDEEVPFGFINLKITNLGNLIKYSYGNFNKLSGMVNTLEPGSISQAAELQFINPLTFVLRELAAKNPLSHNNISVFEITRAKRSDIFINKTPPYEIFTRLMDKSQQDVGAKNDQSADQIFGGEISEKNAATHQHYSPNNR